MDGSQKACASACSPGLYIADDPEHARDSARAQRLTHQINTMDPTDHQRLELLTELLGAFGEGSEIRPPLRSDYGYQTFVGARCFANWGLISLDVATVTIGDNVWLGGGVIVCPGVRIDADTVVGAGAVVVRDLPAGGVAVGSPARVVRAL